MSNVIRVTHTSKVVRVTESLVRVIAVNQRGLRGARGLTGDAEPAIYFDYGDATPAILFTPDDDKVIRAVSLLVLTAFNGTGAKVSIGTQAAPELLVDEDESNLSVISTYETSPGETIPSGTPLKAFITPGLGATAGRCMVLFEYADA